MLIILSPAKTLDYLSKIPKINHSLPSLIHHSEELIKELQKKSTLELSEMMGISEKLAKLNNQRYQDFSSNITENNSRPAIFAFKGDVYQGLNIEKYSKANLDFAQTHLRILSGLYGVLKPLDLIQPYRLEMGTDLKNGRGKNLYEFWGDIITDKLNSEKSDILVNLASTEYFKAVREKKLTSKLLHTSFKEKQGTGYKIIGLFAKKARGQMASYIIKNKLTKAADIKDFSEDGYQFNSNLSSEENYVFTRIKSN